MRFSCDECGRSYVAADEVSGRAFRMRCKTCGHVIEVRPPAPAHAAGDAEPPRVPAAPAPAAPPARRVFDPFEGQDVGDSDAVSREALEILDKTPPAVRLPAPSPAPAPERAAPTPRPTSATATSAAAAARVTAPRARPGRMLPAEDEKMLGPPGQEDRRAFPRWILAVVLAGAAAIAGALLRR